MFNKLRDKIAAKVAHNKRMSELYSEVLSGTSVITIQSRKDLQRVILPNPTVEYILVYIIEQDLFIRLNNSHATLTYSKPQPPATVTHSSKAQQDTVDSSETTGDEQ